MLYYSITSHWSLVEMSFITSKVVQRTIHTRTHTHTRQSQVQTLQKCPENTIYPSIQLQYKHACGPRQICPLFPFFLIYTFLIIFNEGQKWCRVHKKTKKTGVYHFCFVFLRETPTPIRCGGHVGPLRVCGREQRVCVCVCVSPRL